MKEVQVLLAEDNPVDALSFKMALELGTETKFRISHVETLAEAEGSLEREDFHAVVLDLGLPDSQGLTTFTRLQQSVPTTPIVILSGLDDETLAHEAVRKGAQDYILKDKYDGFFLSRSINYAIERKRAQEALRESEQKYRDLFTDAQVAMFRTKLDGTEILDVNRKLLTAFGGTREELQNRPSVIHWVDPREREEMVWRLNAHGSVTDFECKMRNRHGEVRTGLISSRLSR